GEVTAQQEQVVELVRVPGGTGELLLHPDKGVQVDHFPELLLPEQLTEEVAVERQRLGAAFCRRRVVLVHVRGDVVEQERGRKRRGGCRLDVDEVDLPRLEA